MKPAIPVWFVRWFGGLLMLAAVNARADINSWINLAGGNWDDASSWSLGVPPASSQSVMITNSGWKAVAINPSTPVNSPGSMTVGSLTIGGTTNSVNTLLLNYFGTTTPLHVLGDFNIKTNSQVLLLSSGVNAGGALNLNGIFDQEGGELTFTSSPTNTMQIEGGQFNLTNGIVTGNNMYLGGAADGFVMQDSGLVSLDWLVLGSKPSVPGSPGNGTYVLQSGWLMVNTFEGLGQNGSGTLTQNGGTNSTSTLFVGPGHYVKNAGGLFAGEVRVIGVSAPIFAQPASVMTHAGGTAIITNVLTLEGQGSRHDPEPGVFNMSGGSLSTPRIQLVEAGLFTQSNGTVNVANELFLDDHGGTLASSYSLFGGNLITSNETVESSWPENSEISQNGGTNTIATTLWINGSAIYQLSGGRLRVPNINFTGNISSPPQFSIIGAPAFAITNESISSLGGSITIQNSSQQLGRLTLEADSIINLAGSSAVLRFADSHTNSWQSQLFGVVPHLLIYNWNGSANGGGPDQLIFGTSSSALTASQVAQIQFVNPTGFAPGTNSARILSTGEVVPDQGSSTSGPVNSWINSGSGNWGQSANWSLGVLPNSAQSVMITNPGFKAVTIDSSTPINFPGSMTVSNLTITSPTNSFNTLVLNVGGAGNPLVIGVDTNTPGSLLIGSNSAVVMYSSGLIVNNALGPNNSRLGGFEVDGVFSQSNSSEVVAGFIDLSGMYTLDNGQLFIGDQFIHGTFGHNGTFAQQSGSNYATRVTLTWGLYDFRDGLLSTKSLAMTNGAFDQFGGYHTNGGMIMTGTTNGFGSPVTAVYTLEGGTLETPSITMNQASFNHYAGTVRVGTLSSSNSGGGYVINSGLLAVDQIQLSGVSFNDNGGTMAGARNLNLENAYWNEWHAATQMGQLKLAGNTDSFLYLLSSPSVFQFANSSGVPWASGGRLMIPNWSGSLNGGGSQQLYFGTSTSGLTSQQLSQVQFVNPSGLPSGTYAARILSNGEVVPDQGASSVGSVNSWITPGSGNWDQPTNWSLGVLPDSSQAIMITNSVWKAVAINPSTPTNFPNSMTVSNLTIRGATNTENTLLLNYVGTAVPLTVLNGLTLQDGAQILNFNSGLVVQGGTTMITNSDIIQDGGFVRMTNGLSFFNSEYDLTNGVFEAGSILVGPGGPSRFKQYGGTAVIANLNFIFGSSYALYGGTLNLPGGLTLYDTHSSASYLQEGGTNRTTDIVLEPGLTGPSPDFTLNGGLLADNNVSILADTIYTAIQQNGGTHSVSNILTIMGGTRTGTIRPAVYQLSGGTLSARTILLNSHEGDSRFVETNGVAQAQEIQATGQAFWGARSEITLMGGTLSCSNLSWIDGGITHQYGGVLTVSNSLSFSGYLDTPGPAPLYSRYELFGGTLSASNITVGGDWVIGDGTTNRINNPGYFSLSRALVISNAVEQLGRFIIASNATINLAGSASRLSFANSSGSAWAGGATLVVTNWNGNASGGGAEQLKFGTSQSGLTPAQLNQIQFRIGTNSYTAKILSTGEVVPDQQVVGTSVTYSRQGNNLVLSWPSGWTLQTATNAGGPYSNVPSATSPYTNDMTASPQRFFRLSQ
jgi:hypothetical protein